MTAKLVEAVVNEVGRGDTPYKIFVNSVYGGVAKWVGQEELFQVHTPKPKVKQAVMEYYLANLDKGWDMGEWLDYLNMPDDVEKWVYGSDDFKEGKKNQYALATLITYGPEAVEVEKEKKYKVTIRATGQTLRITQRGEPRFDNDIQMSFLTMQELAKYNLEGVFNNPMFEVEEV